MSLNSIIIISEADDYYQALSIITPINSSYLNKTKVNISMEYSLNSNAHEKVLLSITSIIRFLEDEMQEIENEIDTIISTCPMMKKNHDLLMSVNGIGKVMSRELVYLFQLKIFNS